MYISHKNNIIQAIHETELGCRRTTKKMLPEEFNKWYESLIDPETGIADFSGETDYTIVLVSGESVNKRLGELSEYIDLEPGNRVYNIKWSDKLVNGSHFVPDDSAKDASNLAKQWKRIRAERDRLIAETDWMMLSDTGTVSAAWKNYRKALREIPQSQDSAKTFADIKWPDKPSS